MISSLATTFFPNISTPFSSDSSAVAPPRETREVVKTLDEVKSPLIQMSEFFAGIDSGIIKLVNIAKESLGLDKRSLELEKQIANIMASDLALEEKESQIAELKSRDANIAGEDTDVKRETPVKDAGVNFLDTLKKAFDDLTANQLNLGDFAKIFLFGSAALALGKIGDKFDKQIQSIIKYFNETVIPGLQELDKDIRDSRFGYLGIGGALSASFYRIAGAFGRLVSVGSVSALKFVDDIVLKIRKGFAMPKGFMGPVQMQSIGQFFKSITGPGSFLGRIFTILGGVGKGLKDAAMFVVKFPGIAQILGLTGAVAKFLGPIGLIVQGIVGVVGGLINAVKILNEGGSVVEALGGFAEGFFDAVIGATLNLLTDILGFIVKKLGFEKFGQKLQDMDFSLDTIFTKVRNAFFSVLNSFIKLYNKIVPERKEIELFEMKESKVAKQKREEKENIDSQLETNKIINENKSFFSSEVDNKDLVINKEETNTMSTKNDILKTLATNKTIMDSKPTVIVQDNKIVKGGDTVSNTQVSQSPIRVEHTDQTAKALNFYMFGNAHA